MHIIILFAFSSGERLKKTGKSFKGKTYAHCGPNYFRLCSSYRLSWWVSILPNHSMHAVSAKLSSWCFPIYNLSTTSQSSLWPSLFPSWSLPSKGISAPVNLVIQQGKVLSTTGTRKSFQNLLAHSIANPSTQQIAVLVPGINLTERKFKAFQELKWPDCIQTIEFSHRRI